MARYPQGVRSYIPQIQPFQSDFTFLAAALKGKQNAYDKNYEALNKLYGKLYYADLSHEDNQEKQQELVKEIDFNLNRVAGLDLSLDKNVQQAKQVFQPFYQDKNLLYDIAATSNIKGSIAGAKSLQASTKEEEYNQYWQTGIDKLNYKLAEFKETPVDQLQSTGLASESYTPYVNVRKIAMDYAKELGIDMENVSWSPDGRYRITTTNGTPVQEPLARMFESVFGGDPRVQEVYKTQAYVDRKNYAYGNAANFGGDREAAEMDYLKDKYQYLKQRNKGRQMQLENQSMVYGNALKTLEKKYAKTKDPAIKASIEQFKYNKSIVDKSLQMSKAGFSTPDDNSTLTTTGGFINPYGDVATLRRRVDSGMANSLMGADLNEAAANYAKLTQKVDIEKDEYKYLEVEQGYYDRRQAAKIEADKAAATIKYNRDIALKDIQGKLDSGAYEVNYDPETGVPSLVLSDDAYAKSVIQDEGGVPDPGSYKVQEFIETIITGQADKAIGKGKEILEVIQSEIKNGTLDEQKVKQALGGQTIEAFAKSLTTNNIISGSLSPGEKQSFALSMGRLKALVQDNRDVISDGKNREMSTNFWAIEKFNTENESAATAQKNLASAITDAALAQGFFGAQYAFDSKGVRQDEAQVMAGMAEAGYIIRNGKPLKVFDDQGRYIGQSFKDMDIILKSSPGAMMFPGFMEGGPGERFLNWAFGDNRSWFEKLDDKIDELSTNKYVVGNVPIPFAGGSAYGSIGALTATRYELFPGAKGTPGYQNSLYAKQDIFADPLNIGNAVSIKGNGKIGLNDYNNLNKEQKRKRKKALATLTQQFFTDLRSSKNEELRGSSIQFNNMFAGDLGKGSITIKPNMNWVKEYAAKSGDADEVAKAIGIVDFDEGGDIAINGITWSMPLEDMQNPVTAGRTHDVIKNWVDVMGRPYEWTAADPRFKVTVDKNDLTDGYEINYEQPFFNKLTGKYEIYKSTDNALITDDGFGLTPAIGQYNNTIYTTLIPQNQLNIEEYNSIYSKQK